MALQFAVIGLRIDSPEAGATDIGQPGTESITKEPEEPKDNVAISSGISHDLDGLQLGLLLEDHREQDQAVA